jgi:hypothetical protein
MGKQYLCEATSVAGFIQQLAVSYLTYGYWFYVTGRIPEGKDPRAVDEKLIAKYDITLDRPTRSRRKLAGLANIQYLRYDRFFVLIATHGQHKFYQEEAGRILDVRETPIKFAGYSVSYRGGHPHVRIAKETYLNLKAYFTDFSVHRSKAWLEAEFRRKLHYEAYAPVRTQNLAIWRAVNEKRRSAGFEPLARSCLRLSRRPRKVFEPLGSASPRKPLVTRELILGGTNLVRPVSPHLVPPTNSEGLREVGALVVQAEIDFRS